MYLCNFSQLYYYCYYYYIVICYQYLLNKALCCQSEPRANVLRWSGTQRWRERWRVWRAGHAGKCRRTEPACSWVWQVRERRPSGIHGCQRHVTAGSWTLLPRPTRRRLGSTARTASASPNCTNRHKAVSIARIIKRSVH